MEEIHKLRAQISNIVQANFPDADTGFVAKLKPPNDLQVRPFHFTLLLYWLTQFELAQSSQAIACCWFH
jgi:ATP-dependent RNA helicase DHX37/DHR1